MDRLVALLRGINVGGHRKLPMARLRELAEQLGWSDVETYVQSGNLVFTAPARTGEDAAASALSAAVEEAFGYDVPVVVRTRAHLADIVAADPFGARADNPARYQVLFLGQAPDPAVVADLDPDAIAPDAFLLRGREVYLWTPDGVRDSRLTRALSEQRLGTTATARNWRTVLRLLDMTGADGG